MNILHALVVSAILSLGGLALFKGDPPVLPNGGVCIDPDGHTVPCSPLGG